MNATTKKVTRLNRLITELLIMDSVPLSDAWKRVLDRAEDMEHAADVEHELNAVKKVRGWVEMNMCMFCGTVSTIEEITAAGGLSCCPERRMVKTYVPEGYRDPAKDSK